MRRGILLIVVCVLIGGLAAFADQLQWNDASVCAAAVAVVKQAEWIVTYCSLCSGEFAETWSVKGVSIAATSADGLFEVVVSGTCIGRFRPSPSGEPLCSEPCEITWGTYGIDLAYTYVLSDDGVLRPIGRLLGLPCTVALETISFGHIIPYRIMAGG